MLFDKTVIRWVHNKAHVTGIPKQVVDQQANTYTPTQITQRYGVSH